MSLDVSRLAEQLREGDNDVFTMAASPVGAHSSDRSAHETLNNVDMVILIVRIGDEQLQDGVVQPYQNVIREAGVIQGRLGMDRVIFLVEEGVSGLSTHETAIPQIRFLPYTPESASNEVNAAIRTAFKLSRRDLHEARSIKEQLQSDNLRASLGLIVTVSIVAIVSVGLVTQFTGGNDEDTETLVNIAPALGGGYIDLETVEFDPSSPSVGPSFEPERSRQPEAGDQVLPAQCLLDVGRELVLDESVVCQGAGSLRIEGFLGPWHNEIASIALSQGTAGTLFYEGNGAERQPVPLTPGSLTLGPEAAQYGVETLELRFSAHGQHVHLYQSPERDGREVTLVFSLDS